MRVIFVCILCAGCSLVNSTSDLRDLDAITSDVILSGDTNSGDAGPVETGPVEAGPVEAGPVEAGPVEAGPVEAGPVEDAGPPCEFPPLMGLEVERPSDPPIFKITFDSVPECSGMMRVTQGGWEGNVDVVAGETEVSFAYTGPRVPLIDGVRELTFVFFTDIEMSVEGAVTFGVRMPVELLQFPIEAGFHENVTYSYNPSLDIANDGTVVFDSNDPILGAELPDEPTEHGGNIFVWRPDGDDANPASVVRTGQGMEQLAAPSISDDGEVIIFANRDMIGLSVQVLDNAPTVIDIPFSGGLVPEDILNTDIRHIAGTEYAVLARVVSEVGDPSYARWVFDSAARSFSDPVLSAPGTNGLLFWDTTGFGYAADDGGSVAFGVRADDMRYYPSSPCMQVGRGRVHAAAEEATLAFAFVGPCSGATRLRVGPATYAIDSFGVSDSWSLLGAANDQSLLLLRDGDSSSAERTNAFVLVEPLNAIDHREHVLNLDEEGDVQPTSLQFLLPAAALSPDGEWAAYALITDTNVMRIHRIRTRTPGD